MSANHDFIRLASHKIQGIHNGDVKWTIDEDGFDYSAPVVNITTTLTGGMAGKTLSFQIFQFGKFVYFHFPRFQETVTTANTSVETEDGVIPARFRPRIDSYIPIQIKRNDCNTVSYGAIIVRKTGKMGWNATTNAGLLSNTNWVTGTTGWIHGGGYMYLQ